MSHAGTQQERPITLHQGTYKKTATTSEAVFMITGMIIGAGILGLPYVVARVGLLPGLMSILFVGLVVLGLHLLIGEIVAHTKEHLQLPGLAGKYLGAWGRRILSFTLISSGLGALLAYIVGEGTALSALFGGDATMWSIVFWSVGSFLVWGGLQRVRKVEKLLGSMVIFIIVGISLYLLSHFKLGNSYAINSSNLLLPFGVILFALHGTPAIAEARALIPDSKKRFRRALIIGGSIPIVVYLLFSAAVVGVSGLSTTEVATIGLGEQFGRAMVFFANIFAVLAMSTGFMGLGTAMVETLVWDHKLPKTAAKFAVITLPVLLFLFGIRNFIHILDVVGGLFIAVEGAMMVLVYVAAKRSGDVPASKTTLSLVAAPVLVFFIGVIVFNIYNLITHFK